MISVGSIFLCFFFSILIALYLSLFLSKFNLLTKGIKLIFCGIVIIFLRMLVPLNFPFTINIPISCILPAITDFLYKPRMETNIFNLFIITVLIGALVKFICLWRSSQKTYRRFLCHLEKNTKRVAPVDEILNKYSITNIRVAIYPQKISPALCGFLNPILVLPEWIVEDRGLEYIVQHEIEHYINGDLWIKIIVELMECLYWWNPFIYILKRKMYLVMELSNDQAVIKDLAPRDKVDYASYLLKTARATDTMTKNSILLFNNCSDLKTRISMILNTTQNNLSDSKIRLFINLAFVLIMIFCSFTFVPEAYEIPADIMQSSFVIPEDSAYFIKTHSGFKLYINDNYIATVDQIHDSLKNIKIVKREDLK